jgi:hypothetical protein
MRNSAALRLALALYPHEFRHRFAEDLITTISNAAQSASQTETNDSDPAGDHPCNPTQTPAFLDHQIDYREILNVAQHGLRARFRESLLPTTSSSKKLRRVSTWLLLAGTLAMAYKLGAFRTPNDFDRQRAIARGSTFRGSFTNNLKFWRYGFGDLLRNNTPTGGDMGSHVWAADALRRDVLPQWRLTGWSNDWYAGMPLLSFYFPLPMLAIAALGTILPFGIAFKIITALGSVTLPFVSRRAMLRFDLPTSAATISALGTFAVLFGRFYDWTGYGGTLFSTMSGEFSFALSSCLAVAFLGSFAQLLRTGSGKRRTALLLGGAGLCHLLPTIWAIVGALIIFATHVRQNKIRQQLHDACAVALLGAGLAGFWLFPFAANLAYKNSMGWERKKNFVDSLFPFVMSKPLPDAMIVALATLCCSVALLCSLFGVGKALLTTQPTRARVLAMVGLICSLLAAVLWWHHARGAVLGSIMVVWIGLGALASWKDLSFDRPAYCLSVLWASCGLVFVEASEFRLWNARVLPFWFLTMFLLAGIGSVHIIRLAGRLANWLARGNLRTFGIDGRIGMATAGAVVFVAVGLPVGLAPNAADPKIFTRRNWASTGEKLHRSQQRPGVDSTQLRWLRSPTSLA